MTSTSDLNIAGSPIYESLVAITGDPYQPPAYQLPDVYGSRAPVSAYDDNAGAGGAGANRAGAAPLSASPDMLSQFLGQMLGGGQSAGDGQSWVAVLIFGGPIADQLRRHQFMQQFGPIAHYGQPGASGYANVPGYGFSGGFGYGADDLPGFGTPDGAMVQAYQQAYQWAAQQQAALAAGQAAAAMPALPPASGPPPALPSAEATQTYGGMLNQDWAGWLGQSAQSAHPHSEEEVREPPYEEPRGGRLSSRLGAAMRELRGR